jgi:hypothetical protein
MANPKEPRRRVREHLKSLLKTTAIAGAALGGSACSCHPLVCDPLPAPICDSNPTTSRLIDRGHLTAQATWQPNDAGALIVSVSLSLKPDVRGPVTFKGDPVSPDGAIGGISHAAANQLSFTLAPTAGVTEVQVSVPIDCSSKPQVIRLGLDVTAPAPAKQLKVSGLE